MGGTVQKMLRHKSIEAGPDTPLSKCLGLCDLTVMGIGSMVGSGIYIMTGIAAKEQAGPAIVVSFFMASLVVLLIMMCYTELASKFHKTGSAYLYLYLVMGELPAFILGFTSLILIIFGGATNARAWSAYLDSLFHDAISNYTETHLAHWDVGPPLAQRPDIIAACLTIVAMLVVAAGATCSARLVGVFAFLNVAILLFTSIVGFVYADLSNWTSPATRGFLPFGWQGVIKGSAACFWALSGFEVISMAVEETKDAKRNIPLSTGLVMAIVTLLYMATSASLTLMTSYQDLDPEAPLPMAFAGRGLHWAQYIVAVGPLCGLTTSILSSLYGFARMTYALAEDGLFFQVFGQVAECSQVPVISTVTAGLLMAVVALFLDIAELLAFSVNLVLLTYALVSACVIILRYRDPGLAVADNNVAMTELTMDLNGVPFTDSEEDNSAEINQDSSKHASGPRALSQPGRLKHRWAHLTQLLFCSNWPVIALGVIVVCVLTLSMLVVFGGRYLADASWWMIVLLVVLLLVVCIMVLSMAAFQQNTQDLHFKTPCVPVVPVLSLAACLLLLVINSTRSGWLGSTLLLIISLVIYFSYGIRHSKLNGDSSLLNNMQINGTDELRVRLLDATSSDEN